MLAVRRSTARDIERCTAIVRGLPDHFTQDVPAKVERDLGAHSGWVAVRTGRVAGFAVVDRRSAAAAEILWIAVDDAERDQGVGSALLDHLVAELATDGVRMLEVKTLDQSDDYQPYVATRAFWERRGFIQIDTIDPLPGWPPGNPAAIYVAALTESATGPSGRSTAGIARPAADLRSAAEHGAGDR
jgi:ribosomal protein S18 acetylase RimI-like enzyme